MLSVLKRLFRQKDYEDAGHWKHAFEHSKTLQEVVFGTIESVVIIAALDIAIGKQFNWVLLLVYCAAYLALLTYLLTFFKYFIRALNEKFEVIGNREVFAWFGGVLSVMASLLITFGLPPIVSAFVSTNFMQ